MHSNPSPSPNARHSDPELVEGAKRGVEEPLYFVFAFAVATSRISRYLTLASALLLASIPLHAQTSLPSSLPADIAAVDHALAGNAGAFRALQEGRVEDAQNLLNATLAQNPSDAIAHQLLCRVFYAQDSADAAIRQCELAVAAEPGNSDHQLWLGRAYGMKARHAGPIAGFSLARKVHTSFERAAQLNPSNVAALSDLGEYYIAAPFIVGGGMDKAQALTTRIMPQFPTAAHRLLGLMAQSNKDLPTAESEFKLAIATQKSTDGHSAAEAWIDLAQFYQTHNRPDDALAAIKSGLAADRIHGPVLVDAASILTAAHRDPSLAERCLRDYLAGRAKTDEAPAFKVHLQLARLLAARGEATEANREAATAAALAPSFKRSVRPAQSL